VATAISAHPRSKCRRAGGDGALASPHRSANAGRAARGDLICVGISTPVFSTNGGTSVSPSYSTLPAIQASDVIALVVGQKPSTANSGTVTTPSGFTLQSSLTAAGG
jgi:hypothetical protein